MLERESVAAAYLRGLTRRVAGLRDDRWGVIARDFERLAPACRGAKVRVVGRESRNEREVFGLTDGLDPTGALLVRDAAGEVTVVRMADGVRAIED
jgi:hypothetical protein